MDKRTVTPEGYLTVLRIKAQAWTGSTYLPLRLVVATIDRECPNAPGWMLSL